MAHTALSEAIVFASRSRDPWRAAGCRTAELALHAGGSDVGHVYRSVQVMAKYAKRFPWTELISAEYDLAHTQDALDDVAAQRVVKALVVP